MSKCLAAGMLGFFLGTQYRHCPARFSMQKMKKQMMKKLGL